MDWIVERGVEKIPPGVSFDQACFVEPVNTCLKGVKQIDPQPGDVVLVLGQGPIGLIFTMMVARTGARVIATDTMPERRELARKFGAEEAFDPRSDSGRSDLSNCVKAMTEGRGADLAIIAASAPGIVEQAVAATRPGARILLFAQTSDKERIEVSGAVDLCRRTCTLRILQRLGRHPERVRRSGVQRSFAGGTTDIPSLFIKSYS